LKYKNNDNNADIIDAIKIHKSIAIAPSSFSQSVYVDKINSELILMAIKKDTSQIRRCQNLENAAGFMLPPTFAYVYLFDIMTIWHPFCNT